MTESQRLRQEIAADAERLEAKKRRLDGMERSCKHEWNSPRYVPIEHPAHHFAGDPPGTMGVDRQLPYDIPASTTRRWSRECIHCGKVEFTEHTRTQNVAGTVRGTMAQQEVPDFGDRGYYDVRSGPSEGPSYHWTDKRSCDKSNSW